MKNVLSICGFAFTAGSTLLTIISFATPFWLESHRSSEFKRLGLWEACFSHYAYPYDSLGKVYDGCGWVFSYDYRPIFDWLNPGWLLAVQIMMTLTMIISVVATLLCLLGLLGFCPPSRAATAHLTNSILMFGSGLMLAISVTLFGTYCDTDRQWLPHPDQNYLSWSFGLAVVAGFLSIFAGMCLVIESLRLTAQRKKRRTPPPFGGYEMKRAPPEY